LIILARLVKGFTGKRLKFSCLHPARSRPVPAGEIAPTPSPPYQAGTRVVSPRLLG